MFRSISRFGLVPLLSIALLAVPSAQPVAAKKAAAAALGALFLLCATGNCGNKRAEGTTRRTGGGDQYPMNREQKMLVQQSLAQMGYYHGSIDGSYGRGTRSSIRSYQSAQGARATGYLTVAQIETLLRQSPRYATLTPDDPRLYEVELQNNLTPADIAQLQSFLNAAGFNAGSVDGRLGRQTRNAIANYKRVNGKGGPAVATYRLLAEFTGAPLAAPNGGTTFASNSAGGAKNGSNTLDLASNTTQGGAVVETVPAGGTRLSSSGTSVTPAAVATGYEVRGVRLGLNIEDVAATLMESFGEDALADTATGDAFGGMPSLNFGLDVIKPFPSGGYEERIAVFFDEEYSELGAVAMFRNYVTPEGMTLNQIEAALAGKYGTETKVPGQMIWISDASAREAIIANPDLLASCGAPVVDMGRPIAFSPDQTWSANGGPLFDDGSLATFTRDCGEVMGAYFDGERLRVELWNSSHISMRNGSAPAADGGSALKL